MIWITMYRSWRKSSCIMHPSTTKEKFIHDGVTTPSSCIWWNPGCCSGLAKQIFLPHSAHRWLTCLSEWHLHYQNYHCNTCMTWRSLPKMQARTQARGLHCCVLTWRSTSVSIQIKFRNLLSLLHEKNRSLIHCLELVEYVSDLCDIQMLATSRNDMDLKDVAYKLEHLCLEKMLLLE